VLVNLLLLGCSSGSPSGTLDLALEMPTVSSVTWTLAWNQEDIEGLRSGAWSTTNNHGYSVVLSSGFAVTHTLSLVPCDSHDTGMGDEPNRFRLPDHAPFLDDSLVELSTPEDMTSVTDVQIGPITFPTAQYCQAYWLVARGGPDTAAAGTSLSLEGQWSKDGSGGEFMLESDFALASITDLDPIQVNQTELSVTLQRPMARLFDDIEFATDNDYTIAWRTLSNLIEQSQVSNR
jgi:hypothetical protein